MRFTSALASGASGPAMGTDRPRLSSRKMGAAAGRDGRPNAIGADRDDPTYDAAHQLVDKPNWPPQQPSTPLQLPRRAALAPHRRRTKRLRIQGMPSALRTQDIETKKDTPTQPSRHKICICYPHTARRTPRPGSPRSSASGFVQKEISRPQRQTSPPRGRRQNAVVSVRIVRMPWVIA